MQKKLFQKFIYTFCSERMEQDQHSIHLFSICLMIPTHNPVGIKMLVKLWLGFSHLCEHKFRHNFPDTLNPLYFCSLRPWTTLSFMLQQILLIQPFWISLINSGISQLSETALANILLHWYSKDTKYKSNFEEYSQINLLKKMLRWIILLKIFPLLPFYCFYKSNPKFLR